MSRRRRPTTPSSQESRWLLLIHQIPPSPNYLRVRIGRRLASIGAVAVKNSVYVLPRGEQAQEDFQWTLREIVEGGGDASICEARFVDGLSDADVEALFHAARDADYAELTKETREAGKGRRKVSNSDDRPARVVTDVERLRRRLTGIAAIDFLGAPGRASAEEALAALEQRAKGRPPKPAPAAPVARVEDYQARTWVTRAGIGIDRMASAWLIRRFIDPSATFCFVPAKGHRVVEGEVRFDMYEGEFTHEGDRCTFEVLVQRFHLRDHTLRPIAQIVHDIDLKDGKFGRAETAGIERMTHAISASHDDDAERVARATSIFDDLYESFRRRRA